MIEACRREVEALHRFFEGWLRGGDDGTEARAADRPGSLERVEEALAEEFRMVTPSGKMVERRELLRSLESARCGKGADFRIAVEWLGGRELGPGLAIGLYRERQTERGSTTERLSSALFRRREGAPEGMEWVHLHETWSERPGKG